MEEEELALKNMTVVHHRHGGSAWRVCSKMQTALGALCVPQLKEPIIIPKASPMSTEIKFLFQLPADVHVVCILHSTRSCVHVTGAYLEIQKVTVELSVLIFSR